MTVRRGEAVKGMTISAIHYLSHPLLMLVTLRSLAVLPCRPHRNDRRPPLHPSPLPQIPRLRRRHITLALGIGAASAMFVLVLVSRMRNPLPDFPSAVPGWQDA